MARGGRIALGAVAGALVAAPVMFFGALTLGEMLGVSQAEGAFAMQVAFVWTPLAMIAGAVLGGWLAGRRRAGQPGG